MSLIHLKFSIARGTVVAALLAAPVAAFALPQVTTVTTVTPRATTARARCTGCSDSSKAKHELLISRLDSLRWEFSNRRLTQAEQDAVSREMAATLMALQQFLESGARVRLAPAPRAEAMAGAAVVGGDSYTFTVQTARRGYLGVTFDGPSFGYPPERPDVIRFIHYPKIASVDPASPAERAGLIIGDTLLAMNGTDVVERSITLSRILIPDEKVTLKVRRDGDAKEFRVVVGEAPAYVARRMLPAPIPAEAPAPPYPPSVRAEVSARNRVPEVAPVPPIPRNWEEPPQGAVYVFTTGLAGARVETISEGLGKAFGVKEGVLVLQVPPGSPAFISGLRDGDVIISAAGTAVTTTRQLSRAVFGADRDEGVKLLIVRDKKQQDLVFRWK